MIEAFVGSSFHDGKAAVCANAGLGRSGPIRAGSKASVETRNRRLTSNDERCVVMYDLHAWL
jgi:hypothetical protein